MQPFKLSPIACLIGCLLLINSAGAQQPAPVVKTAAAVTLEMAPIRVVAAYSKAKYITTIKAESSGRVIELASVGQSLTAGESLGLIADEEYALRLNELKSEVASQQAQLEFLKSESIRLKSLESQNLTSGTALDKNKAELAAAQADIAQARSRLQQLENNISKLTPKAPFNSFVTKQLSQPGQYLNQGQDLLEIMSSDDIEIIAQVPFRLKEVISKGQQWQYKDHAGNTSTALVERFIPAATSNSRMIQVHLKDMSGNLLPGEPVQLMMPSTLPKTVTAVHRDALVLRRQGAHVFVVREGVAHKLDVTTGLAQGEMIAINAEIKAGEQVVIRGNERLRDQQLVQIKAD
ncbi:efflux RND transporter periplasmic adaptor subunit [Marinicella litoralis]|uniref:RND family efflux transporter MFP subunit n=1 Tax=Marinicella litoralis TaxID=644220 RepID=A0A4R6XWH6_9GAMM|nr:efflux RND transporter periplasmic adaptor subunit [Marinicella litoralis]TDR20848.1 RND family efflux transporter MFP subunit [Marinicella litoralis]